MPIQNNKYLKDVQYSDEDDDSFKFEDSSEDSVLSNDYSTDEEISEEIDSGSDLSIDDVFLFEPISNNPKTSQPSLNTKVEGSANQFNNSNIFSLSKSTTMKSEALMPLKKPPPPPPPLPKPPVNKKLKLTKDELRKYEVQINKMKNKFGFIRREDFLFCCFTTSTKKSLRFFKRLIVLEEGSILCHLTSSAPSYCYFIKDDTVFEGEGDTEKEKIKRFQQRKISSGHEDVCDDFSFIMDESDENNTSTSDEVESVNKKLRKSLKKREKKYKYELINLKNCNLSDVLYDDIDKKYFFNIQNQMNEKRYFFLGDSMNDLYLWYLAIQSNMQNLIQFSSSQTQPDVDSNTPSSLVSSMMLILPLESLTSSKLLSTSNSDEKKNKNEKKEETPLNTNYTCFSVTPMDQSPNDSDSNTTTQMNNALLPHSPERKKSPRKQGRKLGHRRHVSLTINDLPNPSHTKHNSGSTFEDVSSRIENVNMNYKKDVLNDENDNNIKNDDSNEAKKKNSKVEFSIPPSNNVHNSIYPADDEGDYVSKPLKKPFPHVIAPLVKTPTSSSGGGAISNFVTSTLKKEKSKILHGYDFKSPNSTSTSPNQPHQRRDRSVTSPSSKVDSPLNIFKYTKVVKPDAANAKKSDVQFYIKSLILDAKNPLGVKYKQFLQTLQNNLRSLTTISERSLSEIVTSVNTFKFELVNDIMSVHLNYLNPAEYYHHVACGVVDKEFFRSIYDLMFKQYTTCYSKEDYQYSSQFKYLISQNINLSHLSVPPKYYLAHVNTNSHVNNDTHKSKAGDFDLRNNNNIGLVSPDSIATKKSSPIDSLLLNISNWKEKNELKFKSVKSKNHNLNTLSLSDHHHSTLEDANHSHEADVESYQDSINIFRSISSAKTAAKKAKILSKSALSICDTIQSHFTDVDFSNLGPEEILPIFTYVVIKANVSTIYSECRFTEDFLSWQTLSGPQCYFISFLRTSLALSLHLNSSSGTAPFSITIPRTHSCAPSRPTPKPSLGNTTPTTSTISTTIDAHVTTSNQPTQPQSQPQPQQQPQQPQQGWVGFNSSSSLQPTSKLPIPTSVSDQPFASSVPLTSPPIQLSTSASSSTSSSSSPFSASIPLSSNSPLSSNPFSSSTPLPFQPQSGQPAIQPSNPPLPFSTSSPSPSPSTSTPFSSSNPLPPHTSNPGITPSSNNNNNNNNNNASFTLPAFKIDTSSTNSSSPSPFSTSNPLPSSLSQTVRIDPTAPRVPTLNKSKSTSHTTTPSTPHPHSTLSQSESSKHHHHHSGGTSFNPFSSLIWWKKSDHSHKNEEGGAASVPDGSPTTEVPEVEELDFSFLDPKK